MRKGFFWKMAGAGNDFIIINGMSGHLGHVRKDFVKKLCTRGLSVGADGVIIIQRSRRADFKVKFYNSDGSISRFCGNGSRCASRFAYLNGISGEKMAYEGDDGIHHAIVRGAFVSVSVPGIFTALPPVIVSAAQRKWCGLFVNVGVPHVVIEVSGIEELDVELYGRVLRNHKRFSPCGANIDFVQWKKDGTVRIRTYERGVERETLSCGSGCVAASVYGALVRNSTSPLVFHTQSSCDLRVTFERAGKTVRQLFLEGDARIVFMGELCEDAGGHSRDSSRKFCS